MITVMIVEDEVEVRQHLSRLISRFGFSVVEAGTADEAVAQYISTRPSIVFLDYVLPGGANGDEVLRQIRRFSMDTQVYFMTGYEQDLNAEKGKKMGAQGYFCKPIMYDDLKVVLESLRKAS